MHCMDFAGDIPFLFSGARGRAWVLGQLELDLTCSSCICYRASALPVITSTHYLHLSALRGLNRYHQACPSCSVRLRQIT